MGLTSSAHRLALGGKKVVRRILSDENSRLTKVARVANVHLVNSITPIPFERQDPQGAQTLQKLYQDGGRLIAYFWQRGYRSGVGRTCRTPNHTPIVLLPDGKVVHLA